MDLVPQATLDLSAPRRELLGRLLEQELNGGSSLKLRHFPDADVTALSFSQQRLWFLAQLDPGLPAYHFSRAWRLNGSLDVPALERSLATLVQRHEVLRAIFPNVEGRPVQSVLPPAPFRLPCIDLAESPNELKEAEALRIVTDSSAQSFDLGRGPLFRAAVVRLSETSHILLLSTHHIVFDGWSLAVFLRELGVLYNGFSTGRTSNLPELPIRYADFVHWQRERFSKEHASALYAYWKPQLDGVPELLPLPTDRPRPSRASSRGARHTVLLPPALIDDLKALGLRHGATVFMTLLAAFQTFLHRYTGEQDIVVGSPIANRAAAELEGLIGFFANTLPLRTKLGDDPPFVELLRRVKETALGAYAHQDLPFEKLVDELGPGRTLSHTPVVQVAFGLQPAPTAALSGLTLVSVDIPRGGAKFDLTLSLLERADGGLAGLYEYRTDLFDEATIVRMAGHFQTLLEGIVRSPERRLSALPLVPEAELRQLVVGWNATATDFPGDQCVHQLFEIQVRTRPEAIALTTGDRSLTYRELNGRANRLAHALRAVGVGPEAVVAVCLDRGPEFVIALLAILKAGGAYLPLDAEHPRDRLALVLRDASARVLLTEQRLLGQLPVEHIRVLCLDADWPAIAREPPVNLPNLATAGNLAYVIYTSGSTGVPKGVAVPHRAVNRLVINTDYVTLGPSDVVAQAANGSFDATTFEIWGALLNGARLDVVSKDVALSPRLLASHLQRHGITTLFLTTALFNRIAGEHPAALRDLGQLLFGGEAVDPIAVRRVLEAGAPRRLVHVYGPTEATTFASSYAIESVPEGDATIPIGRPIANTRIYLLNKHLNPVPINVTGEIYIGGPGVARGYLNRPDLTAEKFIADPFASDSNSRLYRTGDLARYRADGNIEFLGRLDDQVKLRGFRIEPAEIEAVFRQHPSVRSAAVIVRAEPGGEKRLVAYVVADQSEGSTTSEIRRFLGEKLPDYMVPSAMVFVETLPLNAHGKVDRDALPAPPEARPDLSAPFRAARNPLEVKLTGIWEQVLGTRPIGIHDNFFDLGGHSLMAVRLVARMEKLCGVTLTPAVLFKAPTVAQCADLLHEQRQVSTPSTVVAMQPAGDRPPLFCIHGGGGHVLGYADLARRLGADQPVYGVQAVGVDGHQAPHTNLEAMAAHYVSEIRHVQPQGPYYLSGLSLGGVVAYEMARQLYGQGQRVALLALFDASRPGYSKTLSRRFRLANYAYRARYHAQHLLWGPNRADYVARKFRTILRRFRERTWQLLSLPYNASGHALPRVLQQVRLANRAALRAYRPQPYPGRVTLFLASERNIELHRPSDLGWAAYATGGVEIHRVAGDHVSLIIEPAVGVLADQLRRCLERARATCSETGSNGHETS